MLLHGESVSSALEWEVMSAHALRAPSYPSTSPATTAARVHQPITVSLRRSVLVRFSAHSPYRQDLRAARCGCKAIAVARSLCTFNAARRSPRAATNCEPAATPLALPSRTPLRASQPVRKSPTESRGVHRQRGHLVARGRRPSVSAVQWGARVGRRRAISFRGAAAFET